MLDTGPHSTARLLSHPIHPMLIPFPIAFFVGAFATDLLYLGSGDDFWARASLCLLVAGLIGAALAAVAGFIDFFGDRRIRALSHAWQHMLGNLVLVLVEAANLYLRLVDPAQPISSLGVYLSGACVLLLLFTGWRGGDLVYRHRVGVPPSIEVSNDRI